MISYLFMCTSMLIGLGLVAVGALVVRKANPTSGYLFIGAGGIMFLTRCCFGLSSFENLHDAGMDFDVVRLILMMKSVLGSGELVLVAVLLAVAFVGLAKKVPQGAG